MKQIVLVVVLGLAVIANAQQGQAPQATGASVPQVKTTNMVERQRTPTYSDVYCAGFITNQPPHKAGFVAGGWGTPHVTRFGDRDYVYLSGGGFSVGTQYSIVREVRDPNQYEVFRGQDAMLRHLGHPYADVGRVRVVAVRGNIAVTQVEFNCSDIMPGDAAVPFVEKQTPAYRPAVNFDRFAPPNGKLTGKIVMAKDFDTLVGTGRKVYLNVGANQGVKVGDYFRAVRTYDSYRYDEVDNLSFQASFYDETQVPAGNFPYTRLKEFPRMSLGEMVVLSVYPTSSTAMITLSLEDIHLGDGVELEEAPPASATRVQPGRQASPLEESTAKTPPAPPSIACSAEPPTVSAGETSTISCEASSPDNRPLSFSFTSTNGQLMPRDNTAVLDTHDLATGSVQVLATVSDDRDLSASSRTTINIEMPRATLAPAKLNQVAFKRNSAYVDNTAKAVLDEVALRLQHDPESSLVVLGLVENGESRKLAERRAANAADYLSKSKGIDTKRLQLRDGGEYGNKAELWEVPPGARLDEAQLQH